MSDKIARGFDIGFGCTKVSSSTVKRNGGHDVVCMPSLVSQWQDKEMDTGLAKLSLINVKYGGDNFAVGPDIMHVIKGNTNNLPHINFYYSSKFKILFLAALALAEIPKHGKLSLATIGLPLEAKANKAICEHLKKTLAGAHKVPDISHPEKTRLIDVEQVITIAQPIGTLISQSLDSSQKIIEEDKKTLIIDIGYGTVCWIVSDGLKLMPWRSGDCFGGASSIISSIISKNYPKGIANINLQLSVDRAIRENKKYLTMNGDQYETESFAGIIADSTQNFLNIMSRQLGDTSDIDKIIVTGGGLHLYKESIALFFGGREILVPKREPRFENVRGFQLLAQSQLETHSEQ